MLRRLQLQQRGSRSLLLRHCALGHGRVHARCKSSSAQLQRLQYLSLYNYTPIEERELPLLRKRMVDTWSKLEVLGRIYIAQEGLNAQLILPAANVDAFATSFPDLFGREKLNFGAVYEIPEHMDVRDSGIQLFEKLDIRIRKQIVADGFEKAPLNLQDSGNAVPPDQWHRKLHQRNQQQDHNTLVLDVRNFYEHEVGRFDGATRIMVDTFRDTFDALDEILENHKASHDGQEPKEVMMYCTGGIRCEKVGAYLKQHKGIDAIHKLQGGIVNYQRFLKENPSEESLFKGKNFVFDQRCVSSGVEDVSAEVVTSDVLGKCFQCGAPCNDHTNCSNTMCGGLILQCSSCRSKSSGACSDSCREQVLRMQRMQGKDLRVYRKKHASRWIPSVPNALSRVRSHDARGFTTTTLPKSINSYVNEISSPLEDDLLLRKLRETTQRDWPKAEQLIDEPQSKALSFLVQLTGAHDILEIGCFTGYSALALANGLPPGQGTVTTCDINEDTMAFARTFFDRSSRKEHISTVVSDGMAFLDACALEGRQFDFIFIDANKRKYVDYFNAVLDKRLLRTHGLLAFDNTLFRGRVLAYVNGDTTKKERIAAGLAAFNSHVSQDERVVSVLLPLWDGLTLVRQK